MAALVYQNEFVDVRDSPAVDKGWLWDEYNGNDPAYFDIGNINITTRDLDILAWTGLADITGYQLGPVGKTTPKNCAHRCT